MWSWQLKRACGFGFRFCFGAAPTMGGISIPALLRSTCVGIAAGNRNKERAGFSGIREARTDADAATEERMIQLQLQPEIEAELAA
jgi:hypothetical protein